MTVEFALFLSPDGIALAHRQAAGHWALIGEASPDSDDLPAAMAALHDAGAARAGEAFEALLVLPDDQVLYTSFMAPTNDPDLVTERVVEGLDGLTPYAVSDLSFEWRAVESDRVKVAVVAHETLSEAQSFAEGFGFKGIGFAAMPPFERYPGMPVFGDTDRTALEITPEGLAFGNDDWGTPIPEPIVAEPVVDDPEPASVDPVDQSELVEPLAPVGDMPEAAPPPAREKAAPPGEETAAAAASDEHAVGAEALTGEPEADVTAEAEVDSAGESPNDADGDDYAGEADLLAALVDPTLEQPIPTISQDDAPDAANANASAQDEIDTPEEAAPEPPAAPKRRTGEKSGSRKSNATAAQKPAKVPRFSEKTQPDAPEQSGQTSADAGPDTKPAFSARRGKATTRAEAAGRLVGERPSRLGFGKGNAKAAAPVLHPDTALTAPENAPPDSGSDISLPGSRLAAQLARVRDASKTREPKVKARITPPSPPPDARISQSPLTTPAQPSENVAAQEAEVSPSSGSSGATLSMSGLLRRRSGTTGATASQAQAADAAQSPAQTADTTFTSGLLARKPVEPSGPSFRTGLILTLILLLLLAMIAVWSVVFLPDSPVARFLGFGSSDNVETAAAEPFDGPAPPSVSTASPGIGIPAPGSTEVTAAEPEDQIGEELAALAPVPEESPLLSEPEVDPNAPSEEIAVAPEPETAPVPAPLEDELPDIDADFDLPPLPPLPEDLLPSVEETERIYAEDGIWARPPDRPSFGPLGTLDDVYIASIDPAVPGFDAIALADPGINPVELLRRVPSPPAFGSDFDVDARGLVDPTPEGIVTPEGAFVVAGRPPVSALPRPREVATEVEAPVIAVEDAILGTFRPTQRPGNLAELRERQLLGGFSASELSERRPPSRPQSAQEAAAQASLFPRGDGAGGDTNGGTADEVSADGTPAAEIEATQLAVASSRMPSLRPGNFAAIVAAAERAPPEAVPARAAAAQPSIPSNASVTRAATETNAIRLRDVNLIGVTGTPSDRRALVRLSSGRFVRVGVGDRLDGGRVAAIGEDSLQYIRNGRNITLDIPG